MSFDLPCATHVQFRKMGYQVVDMICSYMKDIDQYPVKPDVEVSNSQLHRLHNLA